MLRQSPPPLRRPRQGQLLDAGPVSRRRLHRQQHRKAAPSGHFYPSMLAASVYQRYNPYLHQTSVIPKPPTLHQNPINLERLEAPSNFLRQTSMVEMYNSLRLSAPIQCPLQIPIPLLPRHSGEACGSSSESGTANAEGLLKPVTVITRNN
jgi:hypothetical protein